MGARAFGDLCVCLFGVSQEAEALTLDKETVQVSSRPSGYSTEILVEQA